jgi:hypothetical protein
VSGGELCGAPLGDPYRGVESRLSSWSLRRFDGGSVVGIPAAVVGSDMFRCWLSENNQQLTGSGEKFDRGSRVECAAPDVSSAATVRLGAKFKWVLACVVHSSILPSLGFQLARAIPPILIAPRPPIGQFTNHVQGRHRSTTRDPARFGACRKATGREFLTWN